MVSHSRSGTANYSKCYGAILVFRKHGREEMKQPCLKSTFPPPVVLYIILTGHSLEYFFSDLDRLFDHQYQPTEQDTIQWRVRTIGITETVFYLQDREVTVVVCSQKFERQKWMNSLRQGRDEYPIPCQPEWV